MTVSDRRLALDIMSLLSNAGRAPPAACRRLRADEGLRRFLNAVGPADDGLHDEYKMSWDGLKRHVRKQAQAMRVMEPETVRRLLPAWRAQGLLLAAVCSAAASERAGEADEAAEFDGTEEPVDGGFGAGFGGFGGGP